MKANCPQQMLLLREKKGNGLSAKEELKRQHKETDDSTETK